MINWKMYGKQSPLLAQMSYYMFFVGIYFFAKKYFMDKRLAPLLIVAFILFRFYGNETTATTNIQSTPM